MDTTPRLYVQQFDSDKGESVHLEHEPRDFQITFAEEEPGDTWAFAAWFWLAVTVIATLAFCGAIAFTAGALLRAYGLI